MSMNNDGKLIIKDKAKRIFVYVLAVLFVINTITLVNGLYNVKNNKSDVKNEIVTTVKEVTKDGKVEKTKEVKTTENKPKTVSQTFVDAYNDKGKEGVWVRHLVRFGLILLGYWITNSGIQTLTLGFLTLIGRQNNDVEKQIQTQRTKTDILKHFTPLSNQDKFSTNVQDKSLSGHLDEMIKQMKEIYLNQFEIEFKYDIYTPNEFKRASIPSDVKKLEKKNYFVDYDYGVPVPKAPNLPFDSNYLAFKVTGYGNQNNVFIVLLKSSDYVFDKDDAMVLAGLAGIATGVHRDYVKSETINLLTGQSQQPTQ